MVFINISKNYIRTIKNGMEHFIYYNPKKKVWYISRTRGNIPRYQKMGYVFLALVTRRHIYYDYNKTDMPRKHITIDHNIDYIVVYLKNNTAAILPSIWNLYYHIPVHIGQLFGQDDGKYIILTSNQLRYFKNKNIYIMADSRGKLLATTSNYKHTECKILASIYGNMLSFNVRGMTRMQIDISKDHIFKLNNDHHTMSAMPLLVKVLYGY